MAARLKINPLPLRSKARDLLRVLLTILACGATHRSLAESVPTPEKILLKDYSPRPIFKIFETRVEKASFQAIDAHSHKYAPRDQALRKAYRDNAVKVLRLRS